MVKELVRNYPNLAKKKKNLQKIYKKYLWTNVINFRWEFQRKQNNFYKKKNRSNKSKASCHTTFIFVNLRFFFFVSNLNLISAESNIYIDERPIIICRALDKDNHVKLKQSNQKQENADKRNLYLANEGGILLRAIENRFREI